MELLIRFDVSLPSFYLSRFFLVHLLLFSVLFDVKQVLFFKVILPFLINVFAILLSPYNLIRNYSRPVVLRAAGQRPLGEILTNVIILLHF